MLLKNQVDTTLSTTNAMKARRTQSMLQYSPMSELNPNTPHVSPSTSTGTITSARKISESKPIATRTETEFQEVELQPLREETMQEMRQAAFPSDASLIDASIATYSTDQLIPSRDGVFARVEKILQYGAAAATGSALTIGGLEIQKILNKNNTETLTMNNATEVFSLKNATEVFSLKNTTEVFSMSNTTVEAISMDETLSVNTNTTDCDQLIPL